MTDFVGRVNSPLFQVHVSERRSKSDVVVQFIVTIITLYITLMTAWLVFNMKVFKCLIVSNNCRPIDNLTQRASSWCRFWVTVPVLTWNKTTNYWQFFISRLNNHPMLHACMCWILRKFNIAYTGRLSASVFDQPNVICFMCNLSNGLNAIKKNLRLASRQKSLDLGPQVRKVSCTSATSQYREFFMAEEGGGGEWVTVFLINLQLIIQYKTTY